jgi:hypothetical protein
MGMPRTLLSTRATVLAALAIVAAPSVLAASFPAVVRAVLDGQTTGRLAQMDRDQRAQMTDCVIAALAGLPAGKKRYVAEGASLDEQTDRFGEVVQEDRAKWKQKIASACASIALAKTKNNN